MDNQKEQLYKEKVIDNRKVTMQFAVNNMLRKPYTNRFDLAVGYFYISGLLMIKEIFTEFIETKNGRMNILMGNETNEITKKTIKTAFLVNETDDDYEKETYKSQFKCDIKSLSEEDKLFLMKFVDWVEQKRIEVKVYTGQANYFHAKSYMFYSTDNEFSGDSIVGSSNFSKNGLLGNTELNVYSADGFGALHDWFKSIWNSDEVDLFSDELIKTIKGVYPPNTEYKRYKPVSETYFDLAQIFARPYATLDSSEIWKTLYPHQQIGIIKIQDKLMQYGTAVLADGVGLGKTRTTAGVIKLSMKDNPELKVVIIADKKIHDQWTEDLDAVEVDYSNFMFTNRETFAMMVPSQLEDIADNYQMIIIDEGHQGFKNRNTLAYRHAEYVYSRAAGKIKGLILTATPWNNRREDVINIGSLFLEVDGIPLDRTYRNYFVFGNRGKSVRKLAEDDKAFSEFWEDLFLQRTRKTYGGESVKYAKRIFPAIEVPFEPGKEQIFSNNFERIDSLHFPYMDTLRFFDSDNMMYDLTPGRLKLMLLKRADSSWISFVNSLKMIESKTEQLLIDFEAIERSSDLKKRLQNYLSHQYGIDEYYAKNISSWIGPDSDEDESGLSDQLKEFQLASQKNKRKYVERVSKKIDSIKKGPAERVLKRLKANAMKDLEVLRSIINDVEKSFTRKDEKYETIVQHVIEERIRGNKVILVSQFRDTVMYYAGKLLKENELNRNDIGVVTGNLDDNRIGNAVYNKREILNRFSPKSKNQIELLASQEINILVGTDTISTGQNLQDATVLMNLDLPYNPMQLEQRIGRIDRPREGNQVEEIEIYTFPTYSAIESILKMTQRLGEKMKGIYEDTDFDDFVLPEYQEYAEMLLKEKSAAKASFAMEKMVTDTESKNEFNPGMVSESHSTAYDEANKRMYDTLQQGIIRIVDPVYPNISFSLNKSTSAAVLKITYRDINKEEIKTETIVVDLETNKDTTISQAEQQLQNAKLSSVYSTKEYSDGKAEFLIRDYKNNYQKVLNFYVDKLNQENKRTSENFENIADNTAKKAASNIVQSTKDEKRRGLIRSKIEEVGLTGKEILELAKNIEFISPENDLYEYVQSIANDVNEFWMHFDYYAKQFDLKNIEVTNGRISRNKPSKKIAVVENSSYELLLANISIG